MKLSTTSWHYKLNDFIWGEGYSRNNANLCNYFWGTILSVLVLLPITIYRAIPRRSSDLNGKYITWGLIVFNVVWGIYLLSQGNLLGIFSIVVVPVLIITIPFWGEWLWNRLSDDDEPDPPKEHRPSMTWEFLKAKKGNYCPRIDWE